VAYQFNDLVVSVVPRIGWAGMDSGSGCEACSDAGSGSVGSCTSECAVDCADSGEIFELTPFTYIDPAYAAELRQLLVYGLAKSQVAIGSPVPPEQIEGQMRPQTVEEVDALEQKLQAALAELQQHRVTLTAQDS
jgi:hypothetical protein